MSSAKSCRTVVFVVSKGYDKTTCTGRFSHQNDADNCNGTGLCKTKLVEFYDYQITLPSDMPECIRELIINMASLGFKPLKYHCCKDWWKTPGVYFWTADIAPVDDSAGGAKRARPF